MSSFSPESFSKKLSEINASQQSIQTISLWLIHHRKHAKPIVELWIKDMKKAKPSKKLTFMYLANDVIQNSKKKGPEFHKCFRSVMVDAFKFALKDADEKIYKSLGRLVAIWTERGIFDEKVCTGLKKVLGSGGGGGSGKRSADKMESNSAAKPAETEATVQLEPYEPQKSEKKADTKAASNKKTEVPAKKKKKAELCLREEIEAEMQKSGESSEPPDAEDLVSCLKQLENSASSDAAIRERIAALPPEVSDVSKLSLIKDQESAEALKKTVDEACMLLEDYNGRLAAELQERKRVARMVRNFILSQKDALTESELRLQEQRSKLEKVSSVRKELKSHIQSLPDLSLLPSVTGGLAPLPSAGDLFT